MNSSEPDPASVGPKGATNSNAGLQPSAGGFSTGTFPGMPVPAVPDHHLLRCIGRGAYGAVWLARNVMGTFRAVKIVHREDFSRDRPFTREYEGLLKFEPVSRSHPNLMQILHVGRHDSYFYYVTELADDAGRARTEVRSSDIGGQDSGIKAQVEVERTQTAEQSSGAAAVQVESYVPRTLQEDLDRRGRLPVRECVALATALASALKYLHDHELVHRDVKPSNVIFVHGVPKLADIGLVTAVGDSRSIVGTEGYLPPEGPGSPQADLYALGKLLYQACTGLDRAEYPRLPPNLANLPDAPALLEFNEVLLKACTKDTTRRYQRAEDLLADLALLERGDSVKRLRRLERHHAMLKRVGIGLLVVGLVVSTAWWQTWRAHRIASRHLAQLHANEGTRLMAHGDYTAALAWLVGALELEAGDSHLEKARRTRIASVLERCPVPLAHFSAADSKVVTADLSPDGGMVATVHQDGGVRLWNVRSASQLGQLSHPFPVSFCQFLPSGDRLLTVTMGQEARLWNLASPEFPPLIFPQAQGAGGRGYGVGWNDSLAEAEPQGRAFLSKGPFCFVRLQPYAGPYENLTLALKLTGKGDSLLVQSQIRQTDLGGRVLFSEEFLDSPAADPFAAGSDISPSPFWGKVFLLLENASSGDEPTDSGRVVYDNVRTRSYSSGGPPTPWRMLDDFSTGTATNWLLFTLKQEDRLCRVENGQLVLSCARLPLEQTVSGCIGFRDPLEVRRNETLEVEVDVVSVQAPHRMVSLTLGHYVFNPHSAPDHPLVAHGRWLVTSMWDAPIRVWDLAEGPASHVPGRPPKAMLELDAVGVVEDMDFSSDTNHLAVVWRSNILFDPTACLRVWNLRSGAEIALDPTNRQEATSLRFSPDARFLAVTRRDRLDLLRTSDWRPAMALAAGAGFSLPRFSPMGQRLAVVSDEVNLVVWDLGHLAAPPMTFSHQTRVTRAAFSPDGRYLAVNLANATVRIWDLVRGRAFGPPLPGALGRFSPDGTQLLLISPAGLSWLWDLSRIAENTLFLPPPTGQASTVFSGDKKLEAEIQNQGIAFRSPTGQSLLVLPEQATPRRLVFSSDDRYLIAESTDQQAWIWDCRTRALLGPPWPVRYDMSLTPRFTPTLPLESRNLELLSALAALLGQERPDGRGGMTPVDEVERARILDRLKQALPREFIVDETKRLRWHREQAQAAEWAMNWDAAVFHWEKALELQAKGSGQEPEHTPESRLAYARQVAEVMRSWLEEGRSRWSVILPRPLWARPEMLDLTGLYSRPLGEPLLTGQPSTAFQPLAQGVQILGGVGFDVRGILDLSSTNHVEIPIGRACQRLHFLHAANKAASHRERAGSYEIRFSNGQKASVLLKNPEDLPPFTAHRFHEIAALSRTNASGLRVSLAWAACAPRSTHGSEMLYLTRATWDVPASLRSDLIESVELKAGPASSAPLVFAITIE